jgi:aspartyl-tRNA(Asn)/glutamyl-tRNA(Gln) amidotransferase subunit A
MDVSKLTVVQARKDLDAKKYSSLDLTEAFLKNIKEKDAEIHAYLEVWEDSARAEAKAADERIARGESMPLLGIPIAVKDNILIHGRHASSASKILENYVASYDATVITKLKAQGAVFLGRTNMDEFAMGSSTENSAFGPTKNPRDTSRVPGGSSGGSAAALAADMALASYGSDTGGSIRQPAAHTGLVGLKPTYGAVSRYGLMAMGSSLDQIGPFGKTIEDTRVLFEAVRGHDPKDGTSLKDATYKNKKPKRIGVPRKFLEQGVDADLLQIFERRLADLKGKGYEIIDIEMPTLPYGLAVYYVIMPAEVSTNLARYDGIRYGLSIPAERIGDVYAKSRGAGFGREVRRRIILGTYVLSAGYADAYYRKARAVRALIREEFTRAFNDVDAIVVPTTPSPAFKIGEKTADPLAMYAEDIFSVPVNLAGVPAISIPAGFVEREGKELPVGFQVIAPHGAEETLFTIGAEIQK